MEFKLEKPELIELDKEIFELNKFYSLAIASLSSFPNIHGVEEFAKQAASIKEKLAAVETSDEFETIFIENSIDNLESQEAYLNYFSKGGITIEKVSEVVLGKGSLDIMKENIKKFNYKKFWEYYLSYREYSYKSIPVDDESLRERFKNILTEMKRDFLEYSKKSYDLPEDYNFDLVLGQPYSRQTFFHPTNRRMEISPDAFFVFKDNEKIKINVTAVIQSLFHEILGHGRQEVYSRKMPLSMQDNSINTSIPSLHVHFEGVSQTTEDNAVDFMRQYQKKYEIEEDYITQRIMGKTSREVANFQAYYKYLGLKKVEDSSFDKDEEFKKITGNHGLSILYSSAISSPLNFIKDAVYPIGLHFMNSLLENLKKELGEEYDKKLVEINKAVANGVFNFKTLPQFVRLYLKRIKE